MYVKAAAAASFQIERYPPLSLFETALLTSAKDDFNGDESAFSKAVRWSGDRLKRSHKQSPLLVAPFLACAEYGRGREAMVLLESVVGSTAAARARPVVNSAEHGTCFVIAASHHQWTLMAEDPDEYALSSISPFPTMLKLAPGLLAYTSSDTAEKGDAGDPVHRLRTKHGRRMGMSKIEGLTLELAPGVLPARSPAAADFVTSLLSDLMSTSLDLHESSFWSSRDMLEGEDGHLGRPEGAERAREWSRAAAVVHELTSPSLSPGDICAWDSVSLHHADDDVILVSGKCHVRCRQTAQYSITCVVHDACPNTSLCAVVPCGSYWATVLIVLMSRPVWYQVPYQVL